MLGKLVRDLASSPARRDPCSVPPWKVMPFRVRALIETSTPCQIRRDVAIVARERVVIVRGAERRERVSRVRRSRGYRRRSGRFGLSGRVDRRDVEVLRSDRPVVGVEMIAPPAAVVAHFDATRAAAISCWTVTPICQS